MLNKIELVALNQRLEEQAEADRDARRTAELRLAGVERARDHALEELQRMVAERDEAELRRQAHADVAHELGATSEVTEPDAVQALIEGRQQELVAEHLEIVRAVAADHREQIADAAEVQRQTVLTQLADAADAEPHKAEELAVDAAAVLEEARAVREEQVARVDERVAAHESIVGGE